ncbi:MAG: pantetheine-phosphate adenylyltransferase [Nitriliruptoraceae bacterium]
MPVTVACPGSFDPVTYGHLDVIERAARHFDEVVVAVLLNPSKQGLFTVEERIALLEAELSEHANVRVESFQGLLVEFCVARGISVVCKGLRAVSDFEYELQMAQMNRRLARIETVLLPTSPEHSYLSSSLVKEVARLGGRIDHAVPPRVADAVRARVG